MGSALTASDRNGWSGRVWLHPWRLHRGGVAYLRMTPDGRRPFDPGMTVQATGILGWFYGELLVSLQRDHNARAFWYDWRQDLEQSADALRERVDAWFGPDAPFHIVAHSMGGLVARAFLKKHAERWRSNGTRAGRLVMLGTPNHGSFLIPQALTGLAHTVRILERLDFQHDMAGVLEILGTFPGLYQMLPSPRISPAVECLYRAESYERQPVSQTHIDRARSLHDWLADVVEPERMVYLAGYGQPTVTGLKNGRGLNRLDAYVVTNQGDGSVPLALGPLRNPDGSMSEVPTFYFPVEHTVLTSNDDVLMSVDEALRSGTCGAARRAAAEITPPAAAMATSDDPVARRLWLCAARLVFNASTPGCARLGGWRSALAGFTTESPRTRRQTQRINSVRGYPGSLVLAPKGRQSIARGVSPGTEEWCLDLLSGAPKGRQKPRPRGTFCRPFGAAQEDSVAASISPGLTPWARNFRPFGAETRLPG